MSPSAMITSMSSVPVLLLPTSLIFWNSARMEYIWLMFQRDADAEHRVLRIALGAAGEVGFAVDLAR